MLEVLTHSLIFKGEAILEEPGTLVVVTAPPQPKCLVLIWNLRPEWSHKADGCRDEGKGKKYQSNQDPTRRHPHSRKCNTRNKTVTQHHESNRFTVSLYKSLHTKSRSNGAAYGINPVANIQMFIYYKLIYLYTYEVALHE